MSSGRWGLCQKGFGCRIRELRPTEGGADWPALPVHAMRQKLATMGLSPVAVVIANSGGGNDDASPNSDKPRDNPSHSPNHDGAIGDDTASDGGSRAFSTTPLSLVAATVFQSGDVAAHRCGLGAGRCETESKGEGYR